MTSTNEEIVAQGVSRGGGGIPSNAARFSGNPDETMIGSSDSFSSLIDTIRSVANRRCSITIIGETGTGKEMVAKKIHRYSDRSSKLFVPVDCTTLTGNLFESQLFGHVKGAFTGATDNTLGFFRAASGGTIFLDEIGEIPLELQAKLLRVLQEGKVTPLGSTQSYPVDVRIVCATNRDLKQMVDEGDFRADLYYRLNVVTLMVPPLRERPEDIIPMANYFLRKLSRFYNEPAKTLSAQTQRILLEYPWPGNVRQLANAIERSYVLTPGAMIETEALPPEVMIEKTTSGKKATLLSLDAANERLIVEALKRTKGQKVAAAKILGIDRRKLNRMIEKLNIEVAQTRND